MNYGIIIKILGNLLLFQIAALLPSLGIALYLGEPELQAFLYTIGILVLFGVPLSLKKNKSKRIQAKEGLTIVTLGWVLVAFFAAFPFYLSGVIPSFTNALFESVSGLTTTGASVIDNVEALSKGLLFWRSFLPWLGGMGIIVLTLAISPTLGVGGYQIYKAETPGPTAGKLSPRLHDTAKILFLVYLLITLALTVLLYFGGLSLFESLIHAFGTIGTGGLSTKNASIGAFNNHFIPWVISIFMIAAGVNFSLYYLMYQRKWRDAFSNSEFRLYLVVIAIGTILITLNLYGNIYQSLSESFRQAFFQVSSFITTTAYRTVDYESWPRFSQGILLFLLFIGGSSGSAAGSIKVIRHLVLLKLIKREISKILHPRAFIPIKVDGKSIPSSVETNIVGFFFLYLVLFASGSLLIMLFENIDFISASTAVAASLGNVGAGFGLVGPGHSFDFFTAESKMILAFLMLLGRLELFTIFVLLTPDFWRN